MPHADNETNDGAAVYTKQELMVVDAMFENSALMRRRIGACPVISSKCLHQSYGHQAPRSFLIVNEMPTLAAHAAQMINCHQERDASALVCGFHRRPLTLMHFGWHTLTSPARCLHLPFRRRRPFVIL